MLLMNYRAYLYSFILTLLSSFNVALASELNVVSSIKPIQLISTAVVGNLGQSKVLLPPSANPHNYQLRPSQLRLLNEADLFVWVGPELEQFLVKVLKSNSVKQIDLIKTLGIKSEEDTHTPSGHSHTHAHAHEGSFDPHIWLDPGLASLIAEAIYKELSLQHPELAPQLNQNLMRFQNKLSIVESEITAILTNKNTVDIYTFHQAFSHFAEHFGMVISGTITTTPEARPGARHLSELTNELQEKQKICLIKEPNFKAPYIDSIAKGLEVIAVTADPLATDIVNSEQGYFDFLKSLAHSFSQCQK